MSLNDFVVDALIRTERYKNTRLWTVENHAKYSTLTAPWPVLATLRASTCKYFSSCAP